MDGWGGRGGVSSTHLTRSAGRSDTLASMNPRSTNHCIVRVESTNTCFTDDAIATRSR